MEVGAVKHALNNEIIHIKKKLNQTKIQLIHKLTRKAKTLKTPRKTPEKLKEKLQRKADAAVAEVLLIKKVQAKDLVRFAIDHKGSLKDYLNKPTVDNEKIYAKILLHKTLTEKYNGIRERFANMPVDELMMTRKERLRLKKERNEAMKLKDKKRSEKKNIKGIMAGEGNFEQNTKIEDEGLKDVIEEEKHAGMHSDSQSNDDQDIVDDNISNEDELTNEDLESDESSEVNNTQKKKQIKIELTEIKPGMHSDPQSNDDQDIVDDNISSEDELTKEDLESDEYSEVNNTQKKKQIKIEPATKKEPKKSKPKIKKPTKKPSARDRGTNIKTENSPGPAMVVDSFFLTASGDNYMTLAEPRQPDEVKEVHQRGNRRMRRAELFGKPVKFSRPFNHSKRDYGNNSAQVKETSSRKEKAANYKSNFIFASSKDNGRIGNKLGDFSLDKRKEEMPAEKLHPSWEAKKQKSGIVAFQGKKVVF